MDKQVTDLGNGWIQYYCQFCKDELPTSAHKNSLCGRYLMCSTCARKRKLSEDSPPLTMAQTYWLKRFFNSLRDEVKEMGLSCYGHPEQVKDWSIYQVPEWSAHSVSMLISAVINEVTTRKE